MKILKNYTHEDLYDGMIVQSRSNRSFLYELKMADGKTLYRAVAKIMDENRIVVLDQKGGLNHFHGASLGAQWCETEESRKMDPRSKREDRLKELGI